MLLHLTCHITRILLNLIFEFCRLCKNMCLLVTALFHFIHNMVNPVLMSLSASHNLNSHKHFRALGKIQRGSKYQTTPESKWSEPVQFVNGLIFKCHLSIEPNMSYMVSKMSKPFRYSDAWYWTFEKAFTLTILMPLTVVNLTFSLIFISF